MLETSNLLGTISAVIPEKQAFIMNFLSAKVAEDSNNRSASRAIYSSLLFHQQIRNFQLLGNFRRSIETLLKMLLSENVQLMTDAKKAILTLFLAKKGCKLTNLNNLALALSNLFKNIRTFQLK